MSDEHKPQDDEIKVTDRRLFTPEGERVERDEPPAEEPGPEPPGEHEAQGAPSASFETLIFGLASTALIHLGQLGEAGGEGATPNLAAAKETIDLLGVLQEKTAGNLTPEERALLENWLFKLRMDFSQKAPSH